MKKMIIGDLYFLKEYMKLKNFGSKTSDFDKGNDLIKNSYNKIRNMP